LASLSLASQLMPSVLPTPLERRDRHRTILTETGYLNQRTHRPGTTRRRPLLRVRDFLLYLGIAIALVVATILIAVYTDLEPVWLFKWIGFAFTTVLVFGDTVRLNRPNWRHRAFWIPLLAGLLAQTVAGILLLRRIVSVPTVVWAFVIPVDYVVVAALVGFFERGPGGASDSG
jgi:hypothetical protein